MAAVLHTSVLIVGAGTAGAVLALELAHHGVASMVLDAPGAEPAGLVHIGGRSMELLRRLGLAAGIRRAGLGADEATDMVWSRRLDRPPVLVAQRPSVYELVQRYATVNDGTAPAEHHQQIARGPLAQVLRAALRAAPLVDLREGWACTAVRVGEDGAAVTAVGEPDGVQHAIRARYVVGCDGPASVVRRCADIGLDALPGAHTAYRAISFRCRDLALHSRGPGLSTLVVGALTLLSRPERHVWVGHRPVEAGEPADPARPLFEGLGAAVEVLGVREWDDTLPVAQVYRRGPVFLAGEAAHAFRPAADAADTGIGDAVDLGWKLAAACHGWGGPALLDSYEAERRPRALMDRELLARGLETGRRFARLAAAGAPQDYLAAFLRQEPALADDIGIGYGGRYASSPVVWHERGSPPVPHGQRITPSTWPGGRPPAVRLADGGQLFDRFGPQLTLVDLTDSGEGRALAGVAKTRGLPVTHLPVHDPAVRACWGRRLVLVRPDQHVAWRDDAVPEDWDAVLTRVCGRF
ncbi:FAD-dependent monooxygenase [Dactylosporangium sp. McL0621]|uniref:FAD-dependent monooxygenase n=1 Tax=Dactylosporangium sp. McL0621 TaxID=3415678 RepID=UPI003CF6E8C4